jgi:glutamate synthase domain-containing protein 2
MMRVVFYVVSFLGLGFVLAYAPAHPWAWSLLAVVLPYIAVGVYDINQKTRALLRNYPVIGHGRYVMELVRPEIQQYFVESNLDGRPFARNDRSIVYQRAKGAIETMPFGTQSDVYEAGYEWINHSLSPVQHLQEEPRVTVGARRCAKPYSMSLLNVSAMSYGSLSRRAVLALNKGAKLGRFAHNTGEGGIAPAHLEYGGDLVYQIGTGYFGCRAADGGFDLEKFKATAAHETVRLVEVKLSQGAKPAHGGILPAKKVTKEIAAIRGVPEGVQVDSPPRHSAFSTPEGLLEFVALLRDASGGKPVGFKLCIGQPEEFVAIVKAMVRTGLFPDFVTVDGGEGGTGAAPFEFSDSVGMPLRDGLAFAHNVLVGAGVRDEVVLIASGKVITGFHMFRAMALGADACNCARGMMFALGCIQARRCNHNDCPVGVATTDPRLSKAIDVDDKGMRVDRYHRRTVESFLEMLHAAGLSHPSEVAPEHVFRRVDPVRCLRYSELYEWLQPSALIEGTAPLKWQAMWSSASSDQFLPAPATSETAA